MAEETTMTNIEIRDFTPVRGINDTDHVVLSLSDGTSGKLLVGLFRSNVTSGITPSIKDSVWWIGSTSTGVTAEGFTPQLRKGDLGIEYKYSNETDDSWKLLVPWEDIKFTFDELTDEQRDLIKLKYSDLTAEEIAELQQPANEMIAVLEQTNTDIQAAEDARVEEFATLKAESIAATEDAQDTADHPTYIGTDNYVYRWDKTAQAYNKTSIYVRGEAFSISKVYPSVAAMNADTSTSFKEGDFCLINTNDVENPEDAQLYVRTASGTWQFLVDMSGAIGFTGKVPQLFIGTVAIGSGRNSAAVTLSAAGTDSDGNPKYNINYVIPCLAYEDLTAEQIAELQRPASDMIAQLQATDDSVKAAESARVSAEDDRVEAEDARADAESIRAAAETVRESNEDERIANENERISTENERIASEAARAEADSVRESNEADRQAAEDARRAAEEARAAAESARAEAESSREALESERESNEQDRQAAEDARIASEAKRTAAESLRIINEDARMATEESRAAAEVVRVSNEDTRIADDTARREDYAVLRQDIVAATKEAWDASAEVRNIPIIKEGTWWVWDVDADEYKDSGSPATSKSPQIQNGTWWTWDDATGQYIDTGQSVNSTYQLTKEKVEGVLVGDIASHTHEHLRYEAQVYDTAPDLSTLTTYTDSMGEHEFLIGNDIYVKDDTENSGYANYKLAHTSSGNTWMRIPQILPGWQIVIVRSE